MNGVEREVRDHRQVWDLIPWVVNGTASDEQRQQVEAHAKSCDDCGRELKFQQSLQSAFSEPAVPQLDPQLSFLKLQARLEQSVSSVADPVPASTRNVRRQQARAGLWRFRARALLAAVVIEAVALAALGNAWWLQTRSRSAGAEYQVLSASPASASAATIRVVLAPGITAGDLQTLLLNANLQIVAGPSEAGVYSLGPRVSDGAAAQQSSLALLRSNPQVRFAEPVSDASNPR